MYNMRIITLLRYWSEQQYNVYTYNRMIHLIKVYTYHFISRYKVLMGGLKCQCPRLDPADL